MALFPTAIVPEGMSYVNAWKSLWLKAKPKGDHEFDDEAYDKAMLAVTTAEKVASLFINFPSNSSPAYSMDSEGGRLMKVHFYDFPKLNVYIYDDSYGTGAAQRALDEYNEIPPDQRFDKNDSYRFSDLSRANSRYLF